MKNLSEYLTGWLNMPGMRMQIFARWFKGTPPFQFCLLRNIEQDPHMLYRSATLISFEVRHREDQHDYAGVR